MSIEVQKARDDYLNFLQNLDACKPSCTGLYETDKTVPDFEEVDRMDALNCYLRKNPSQEQFRDELATVRNGVKFFTFITASWNALQP
jgi:hypothetical protein